MSELKPCPTPRTDAARNKAFMEYQVLYPGKRARPVNDLDMAEVERELIATQIEHNDYKKLSDDYFDQLADINNKLIATQLALKECGGSLKMVRGHNIGCDCHSCKALSNPIVIAAMEGK